MARGKRQISESGIYKICLRGNDVPIFRAEADYNEFLFLLGKYFSDGDGVVKFSLNDNIAEIIVKIHDNSIGVVMKPLLTSYARYYNRIYERTGKVFYDRYKSVPVNSDELDEAVSDIAVGKLMGDKKEILSILVMTKKKVRKPAKSAKADAKKKENKEPKKVQENNMDFWLL